MSVAMKFCKEQSTGEILFPIQEMNYTGSFPFVSNERGHKCTKAFMNT